MNISTEYIIKIFRTFIVKYRNFVILEAWRFIYMYMHMCTFLHAPTFIKCLKYMEFKVCHYLRLESIYLTYVHVYSFCIGFI